MGHDTDNDMFCVNFSRKVVMTDGKDSTHLMMEHRAGKTGGLQPQSIGVKVFLFHSKKCNPARTVSLSTKGVSPQAPWPL